LSPIIFSSSKARKVWRRTMRAREEGGIGLGKGAYFLPILLLLGAALSFACLAQEERGEPPETRVATTPPPPTPLHGGEPSGPLDLDEANVVGVEVTRDPEGAYTFSVTIRHNDTGWDHYADWWRVLTPEGEELGRRVLAHPHETEQPFTRSLRGVVIPEGIETVVVEAHCSVHGYGGRRATVGLTTRKA
jgi:hypothetical protein